MRIKARLTNDDLFDISTYYPIFQWVQCDCCNDLIKRETVWEVAVYSQHWQDAEIFNTKFYKYFCMQCFKNNDDGKKELYQICLEKSHN